MPAYEVALVGAGVHSLLAIVLLVAAIPKILRGPASTVQTIRSYQLVPDRVAVTGGHALPWLEIIIAAGLVLGPSGLAAVGAAVLFAVFTVAIGVNVLRGHTDIDCGCFGVAKGERLGWTKVARSMALAILAAGSLLTPQPLLPVGDRAAVFVIVVMSAQMVLLTRVLLWLRRDPSLREGEAGALPVQLMRKQESPT